MRGGGVNDEIAEGSGAVVDIDGVGQAVKANMGNAAAHNTTAAKIERFNGSPDERNCT